MLVLLLVASAVLGLAIGSFVNVVIARVPAGESVIRPASRCPHCGHLIRRRHNIPIVSYLVLRGRCADCRAPISVRYPLIEAGTAVGFMAASAWAWHRDVLAVLPAWWYLVSVGMALGAIDIAVHRLPNVLVLASYPAMAVLLAAASVISGDWGALGRAGVGMVGLLVFYVLLALVYPAGMGWGDVKLAGVLGGLTAYVGWGALVVGAFAGFALGAVVAVVMMALGRGTGKTPLPFGPFMLLGAVVGVVFGGYIAGGYLGMIGA